jgi:hypothetical protein
LKKQSNPFCSLGAALLLLAMPAGAQPAAQQLVQAEAPHSVAAKRGANVEVPLKLAVRAGYHIQSNAPSEDYLIPTVLNWDQAAPLAPQGVNYPKGESVKYEFAEKPLSVYSGAITVTSRFKVPANAPAGTANLKGKLRYQACTQNLCLPPRTLEVSVPVKVE